ncbi:helix-turn-helix domain-containing protein [Candidatus Solirubrobacter pratensis]|uniref:helix-turn-helix domain-containing protein n=1 Tax=Candidatus Solirubrobacter pratensis TaxID=1298857 RepID=UPI00040E3BE9|nr:helix-turn-helix transcriptional regulator [Candidatus Solirubrobacter pratensis]
MIRDLRGQRGLSQEAVARAADLTLSSYARVERGLANPTWRTVSQIADALGVTLAELGAAVDEARSA